MPNEQRPLKVFLCHAQSDKAPANELYQRLIQDGMDAWLGEEKLLPGQDRELEIRRAVREAGAVVICLSRQFNQAGYQQKEARLALDTAMEQPEGEIFIIPARLEPCEVPESLKKYQQVDLFTEDGYEKLLRALQLDAQTRTTPASSAVHVPQWETRVIDIRKRLNPIWRSFADIKFLSFLIAVIVLFFGNNLYAQMTGHSIFAKPPTPTTTVTITIVPTSTATETPVPTNTPTPTPTLTFTPVPATNSPTTTPTITVVPPMPIGADWTVGCISTLWSIYPATIPMRDRGNGCWNQPLYVFSAEHGDLDFLAQRGRGLTETIGLFAPLPERGRVSFTVRLRDLYNADLWMGVFAEPDITSPGLLMIFPNGDVSSRVIVQKDAHTYKTILLTEFLDQGSGYSISFIFEPLSVISEVEPHTLVTNPLSLPFEKKWLFLGYKGLSGYYSIDGTFLKFELQP